MSNYSQDKHFTSSDHTTVTLTKAEQKAIEQLQRWINKRPKTLNLFGWSGTLVVVKNGADGRMCVVDSPNGINCDGGDPKPDEIDQNPDITYE